MFERLEGDALVQVYARLSLHEALLKRLWVECLAWAEPEVREAVLSDLGGGWERAWIAGKPAVDDERAFAITRTAGELAQHFVAKVRRDLEDRLQPPAET